MNENASRRIFLSTVTAEFGEQRRLLKRDLSLPRVKVQEQGDLFDHLGQPFAASALRDRFRVE